MHRSALIVGATGLVGQRLLARLLDDTDVSSVVALTRRPLSLPHPKLHEGVVDFASVADFALPPVDDYFCCLGTTMAKAGSQAAFRAVDLDLPVTLARMALAAGATRCFVVSALGADPRATVFYHRVKGELEAALGALPFAAVIAFRPSLLAGPRVETRIGERIGLALARPLAGMLPARYRPIDADTVAQAMLAWSHRDVAGRRAVESEDIRKDGTFAAGGG
jgi:uncharacterized protein YbjT (DUF2867 family)